MSPILDSQTLDFVSHSVAQTRRLGERLAGFLSGGRVICLVGDLGSGKTCFVQGLGAGLGVKDPIVSPTFTLIREYRGSSNGLALYHVDLYRLDSGDIPGIGLGDYLDRGGVVAIEWADHLGDLAPGECLQVEFRYLDETKRTLRFSARGDRYSALLQDYKRVLFGA